MVFDNAESELTTQVQAAMQAAAQADSKAVETEQESKAVNLTRSVCMCGWAGA